MVRGVPPPDPPYGPILAIYRPQKCRFGGPGPGARFGAGPEFPETFPGGPRGPEIFPPRGGAPRGPPGPPSGGSPWHRGPEPRMGSGSGVPPDPGIGGLGPALGQGPRPGVPASSIGVGTRYGGHPQTPGFMPAAPGGTVPPGPPQGSGAAGPRSGLGVGHPVMSGPRGTVDEPTPPDDGEPRSALSGARGHLQSQVVALLLLVPGPPPRSPGVRSAPRPAAPLEWPASAIAKARRSTPGLAGGG